MFGLQSGLGVGAQLFEGVLRFLQHRVLPCEELQLIIFRSREQSTPCGQGRLVASLCYPSQRRQLRKLHEMKLEVVGQRLVAIAFERLKDRMEALASQLHEVRDEDDDAATQVRVGGASLQLARIEAPPVEEAAFAQRGVTARLHFDVDLLAALEADAQVEG